MNRRANVEVETEISAHLHVNESRRVLLSVETFILVRKLMTQSFAYQHNESTSSSRQIFIVCEIVHVSTNNV